MAEDNRLKTAQIEFLQGELGKLKQRYDQSTEEMTAIRAEKSKLSQTLSDVQLKLNSYAEELAKVKNSNDTLSNSLKESREVSNRHTEYLSNKCEGIERENKRLIEMQKESQIKEQQMTKAAVESER
jgi:regulator of replication initiation timing